MSGMAWNEPNELPKTPSYLERAETAEAKIEQYKAVVLLAEELIDELSVCGPNLGPEVNEAEGKILAAIQSLRAAKLLEVGE